MAKDVDLGISLSDIVSVEYIDEKPSFSLDTKDVGMQYKMAERHTLEITCKNVVPMDTPGKLADELYSFTLNLTSITDEDVYHIIGYKNLIVVQPSSYIFSGGMHADDVLKKFSEQILGISPKLKETKANLF